MFVTERFELDAEFKEALRQRPVNWGFGEFSKAVYYRTYSRDFDGKQEHWADTVIRVVEGVISIRKDWYRKMGVPWKESYWALIAQMMADAIFEMRFLPPGRGLWAMGTDYIYERGSAALNNCGFVDIQRDFSSEAGWFMDQLMMGVGVGFSTQNASIRTLPRGSLRGSPEEYFVIPDSREGWVESVERLLKNPLTWFDFSLIRPSGSPIRGFGGISSGPAPLSKLHNRLVNTRRSYDMGEISQTRFIADTMNSIGACVVAGNVRRSAELATGSIYDTEFLNLKNYELYPDREDIGWMSNNSVILESPGDFEGLPMIADRIRDNGEPGIVNLMNVQKYGRFKEKKEDLAVGFNPCAEIPLESFELCNLVEVFPTRCANEEEIYEAISLATIYASTVALLPSHREETNEVVARNRRIGVSISGVADWLDATSVSTLTRILRHGYEWVVKPTNERLAKEAGVPASVRLTTVKPSGTVSQLAGVSPGMHWPIYRYYIRRVRVSENSPVTERLIASGVPWEQDAYSDNTLCFEFPQQSGKGKTRSVGDVSIWEQAATLAFLQREWADNAVSNTLTFKESESHDIEKLISMYAPQIKSMSLLPEDPNTYEQMPYQRITREEFRERQAQMRDVDWESFRGSDGQDTRFCDGDSCALDLPTP